MSKLNLNWYIKKYGEKQGKIKFENRKNVPNTLEWYVAKFGDEEGKKKI